MFFEQGPDLARSIGSSTAAHGTLTFTPTSAASTQRTVSVVVEQNGIPRAKLTLGRFRSAGLGAFPTQVPVVLSARRSGHFLSVRMRNPNRFAIVGRLGLTTSGAHAHTLAAARYRLAPNGSAAVAMPQPPPQSRPLSLTLNATSAGGSATAIALPLQAL